MTKDLVSKEFLENPVIKGHPLKKRGEIPKVEEKVTIEKKRNYQLNNIIDAQNQ